MNTFRDKKEINPQKKPKYSFGKHAIKDKLLSLFPFLEKVRGLTIINEQKLFTILSSSIEPIFDYFDFNLFIIDEDWYFRFVNNHYCDIVGKSKNEIINKHISEILTNSTVQRYLLEREIVLSSGIKYGEKYKDTQPYTDHKGNPHLFLTKKTLVDPENIFFQSFKLWEKRMFLGTGIDIIDFENTEKDLKCLIEALNFSKKKYEDGLRAAQYIQQDTLPSLEYISESFPHHALLYLPKHIVSGDFYRAHKIWQESIVAIGDCTWHGMSWAMMSISAIGALNDIVKTKNIYEPAQILKELDKKMARDFNTKQDLPQKLDTVNLDNLDISLCRIDPINKQLTLSLVNTEAYLLKNNQLIELRTDYTWIVRWQDISNDDLCSKSKILQTYYLPIEPWDVLYLFTDGYKDQFWGNTNKECSPEKFWKVRFKKFIEEIAYLPLSEQNDLIKKNIHNWIGTNNQTDDITVFWIQLL